MLKREEYLKDISYYLSVLKNYVELNNKLSLTDINKLSEDFFGELLNRIFDLDLINLNLIQYNFPAIDLGDETSKICYQITASNDRKKIQYSLDKFKEYSLDKKYDDLYIIILTSKRQYSEFDTHSTNFTMNNILDIEDIIKEISQIKSIKKIEEILGYLKAELKDSSQEGTYNKNSHEKEILNLIESEIRNNVTKILRQKILIRKVNIKFTLKEVLMCTDENQFMELRKDEASFLFFGELDLEQYEKFESELLKFNTKQSKYVIKLYMQFKLWNKYSNLFEMRKDEYISFRQVLLEELMKWVVNTDSII